MGKADQAAFAEVMVDRLLIEAFPQEKALYHSTADDPKKDASYDNLRRKVIWHIDHTLSRRQKEVLKLYLAGKKENDIGKILGIKQQVVNIYKRRAIKRLRDSLNNCPVC